jgi:hypothetical protein
MNKEISEILERINLLEQRIMTLERNPNKTPIKGDITIDENDINLAIANSITNCEEAELIQNKVLDSRNLEARILLCFFISNKYFGNAWLTSGNIERITSELGVKVSSANASTKLKSLRAFLESGKVRKNGLPTPYRLNRSGQKHFDNILHG